MSASFGVHVGATSMCIAVSRDGKTDVVANDAGDRVTPAIVAFTDRDQAVGLAAKQGVIRNAGNTVCNCKLVLGKSFEDPEVDFVSSMGHAVLVKKNDSVAYKVQYKERPAEFTPEAITAMLHKNMREIADSHGGAGESHDMVLTVPLNFTDKQKELAKQAATEAGFSILRIINEPVAAALAYDLGQTDLQEYSNVLVYRLGGISVDATLLNVNSGMFRIIASDTSLEYGGHSITNLLVDHFAAEFKRQWKQDCLENKRSKAKLKNAAESCKHILSTMTRAQCSVDSLYEGIDFQCTLSRARLEGLCASYIQRCLIIAVKVLSAASLKSENIHKVVVCGGSGRIPYLQQQLKEMFSQAEILSTIPSDEVIATGAAKQAAILSGKEQEELERYEQATDVPCLPADLLVQIQEGDELKECTIFHKNTPVPVKCTKKYNLLADESSILLNIGYPTDDCGFNLVAQLCVQDLPVASTISVLYHIKSDGSIHVVCSDEKHNKVKDITISAS